MKSDGQMWAGNMKWVRSIYTDGLQTMDNSARGWEIIFYHNISRSPIVHVLMNTTNGNICFMLQQGEEQN